MSQVEQAEFSRLEFISTRWSLLNADHAGDDQSTIDRRGALVMRYRRAIESYILAIVGDASEAADLAQDLFVRLLGGDFASAKPEKGRFRDLLKASIRNLIRDRWRRGRVRRACRFDPSLLDESGEISTRNVDSTPDLWADSWRDNLVAMTFESLANHERNRPEAMAHTILTLRIERPDASIKELVETLESRTGRAISAATFRQRLHRARQQFADLLLEEIARGLDDPSWENVEEELRSLGLLEFLKSHLPEQPEEE